MNCSMGITNMNLSLKFKTKLEQWNQDQGDGPNERNRIQLNFIWLESKQYILYSFLGMSILESFIKTELNENKEQWS